MSTNCYILGYPLFWYSARKTQHSEGTSHIYFVITKFTWFKISCDLLDSTFEADVTTPLKCTFKRKQRQPRHDLYRTAWRLDNGLHHRPTLWSLAFISVDLFGSWEPTIIFTAVLIVPERKKDGSNNAAKNPKVRALTGYPCHTRQRYQRGLTLQLHQHGPLDFRSCNKTTRCTLEDYQPATVTQTFLNNLNRQDLTTGDKSHECNLAGKKEVYINIYKLELKSLIYIYIRTQIHKP